MASSNDEIMRAIGGLQAEVRMMYDALKIHIEQDNNKFEKHEEWIQEISDATTENKNTLTWYAGVFTVLTPAAMLALEWVKTKVIGS